MSKWIKMEDLADYPEAEEKEMRKAMEFAVSQVEKNLPEFTDKFPGACSFDNFYKPGENVNWTTDWRDLAGL